MEVDENLRFKILLSCVIFPLFPIALLRNEGQEKEARRILAFVASVIIVQLMKRERGSEFLLQSFFPHFAHLSRVISKYADC
jgi:hypothetical protein